MPYALTWLPDVLRGAGLKVAEVPGWQNRGRGDVGRIAGVICHHTAGPRHGNMPSLQTLIQGRSDLPGPLCHLGLGRDGTFYVVAAGRANHAGKGEFRNITQGNSRFIGIEAENTGLPNDSPWPAIQVEAYQRGVAAILKFLKCEADFCIGHREYAGKRKSDPDFDMDEFRRGVLSFLTGTTPTPPLIPALEPAAQPGANGPRRTIRRGDHNDLVKQMQARLGLSPDGIFGAKTEAAVREFQRQQGMVPDGIVGPKTWKALDAVPAPLP